MAKDAHASGRTRPPQRHPVTQIEKFLEQELSEAQSRRIQEHLSRCPQCQSEVVQRQRVLRLAHGYPAHAPQNRQPEEAQPSVLDNTKNRGVSGWKVVVGIMGIGIISCVMLLALWLLGGDRSAPSAEESPVADSAAATLQRHLNASAATAENLSYEDVVNIRNSGYACPLLTGLGYAYVDASISQPDQNTVAVDLTVQRGEQTARIVEARQVVDVPANISAQSSVQGMATTREPVVQELEVENGAPENSFRVHIETADADYLLEGQGSDELKKQMIHYISLADQARISGGGYSSDGVTERFSRGLNRLIGQD